MVRELQNPVSRFIAAEDIGQPDGVPALDGSAKIPSAQVPDVTSAPIAAHAANASAHGNFAASAHNHAATYEPIGAVATHAQAADPHPAYATDSDLSSHAADSAAHGSFAASGHTHTGTYEASGAVATHAAIANAHGAFQPASEKGIAGGYADLDAAGKVPAARLPSFARHLLLMGS